MARLPPDVISQLSPHDFGANSAEVWTAIGTGTLALIALIAAVFTLLGLYQTRQARHAETFGDIVKTWGGAEMRTVRRLIAQSYDEEDSDALKDHLLDLRTKCDAKYWDMITALDFFENAGNLVKYRAVSIEMVDNSLGNIVCDGWKMLKPFIYSHRGGPIPDPGYYEEFEKLAKRISDRHRNRPPWEFSPRRTPTKFEAYATDLSDKLRENHQWLLSKNNPTILERFATWTSDKLRAFRYSRTGDLAS